MGEVAPVRFCLGLPIYQVEGASSPSDAQRFDSRKEAAALRRLVMQRSVRSGLAASETAGLPPPWRILPSAPTVLAAIPIVALPALASAATRVVADTGTDRMNYGFDTASACRSIAAAIAGAAPSDTVLVGPGPYEDRK